MRRVEGRDEGRQIAFEGVAVVDALLSAGFTFGQTMCGGRMSIYMVVESRDGYRVVYALPELDPAFTDDIVLLAFREDGKPLSPENSPLRVVPPARKRHARWARPITALKISRAVNGHGSLTGLEPLKYATVRMQVTRHHRAGHHHHHRPRWSRRSCA